MGNKLPRRLPTEQNASGHQGGLKLFRREQGTRVEINLVNWQQEEPTGFDGRRQPSRGGRSRETGEGHARNL